MVNCETASGRIRVAVSDKRMVLGEVRCGFSDGLYYVSIVNAGEFKPAAIFDDNDAAEEYLTDLIASLGDDYAY